MRHRLALTALAAVLLVAVQAAAIVEKKTGKEYPDKVTVTTPAGEQALVATGAALREKTALKVDIYTIVSYVAEGADLSGDRAAAIWKLDATKQVRMDLRRSFSRAKLIGAMHEVIDKNYPDQSAFKAELATFDAYFDADAKDGDVIIFTYVPGQGLTTNVNGQDKGVIAGTVFAEALWSVWFGAEPVTKDIRAAVSGDAK